MTRKENKALKKMKKPASSKAQNTKWGGCIRPWIDFLLNASQGKSLKPIYWLTSIPLPLFTLMNIQSI